MKNAITLTIEGYALDPDEVETRLTNLTGFNSVDILQVHDRRDTNTRGVDAGGSSIRSDAMGGDESEEEEVRVVKGTVDELEPFGELEIEFTVDTDIDGHRAEINLDIQTVTLTANLSDDNQ